MEDNVTPCIDIEVMVGITIFIVICVKYLPENMPLQIHVNAGHAFVWLLTRGAQAHVLGHRKVQLFIIC